MSGRPALLRRRDVKEILCAAQKAGARSVEIRTPGEVAVIVHLELPEENVAEEKPIDL